MARIFILQLIAGIVGGIIASVKGRGVLAWFALCFFVPLLAIVIAFLPSLKPGAARKLCPNCRLPMNPGENVCRRCNLQKPVELVPCSGCGSYIPAGEACSNCQRKKGNTA